ncbi:cell wall hydrolase [Candidatus Saccharibacteria bacterium]|nr:cell wall hydrolase [Candidatus Saccharibacteria bacterium]
MKCFKHLCAKLFLGILFGVMGFGLEVHAAETPEVETESVGEAAVAPDETALLTEARAQDVDRLSRIIQTEGGTFDDKVCVGLTVLHRVDSPQFPNTVEENINAPSQYAEPAKGEVLPENLLAAEYAMQLWESGVSYSVLPSEFLYFAGNGKRNRFHDTNGNHYDAPDIIQLFTPYVPTQEGPDGALFSWLFSDTTKIKPEPK